MRPIQRKLKEDLQATPALGRIRSSHGDNLKIHQVVGNPNHDRAQAGGPDRPGQFGGTLRGEAR